MTNREMYTNTINYLHGADDVDTAELIAAFENALARMDATNEKRKVKAAEKAAEKQAEKAPIREALLGVMGDAEHPMTASMLIEAAGLEDVKPASVPSLMKPYVEDGTVLKVDVKVPGKGTQRGYVLA